MKLIWEEEDEEKESCCLRTKRNTWRGFWLEFRICKMWTFYQMIQWSFNSSQQDSVLNNNYFNQVARKLIPGVNCDYDENTPQRYHPGNTFIHNWFSHNIKYISPSFILVGNLVCCVIKRKLVSGCLSGSEKLFLIGKS